MLIVRTIFLLVVAMGVVLAGFPVRASQCPMMAHMPRMVAAQSLISSCKGCNNTAAQERPSNNGCCGDLDCKVKCFSTGNVSAFLIEDATVFPQFAGMTERQYLADHVLPSHLLNTQDRPPKHLS